MCRNTRRAQAFECLRSGQVHLGGELLPCGHRPCFFSLPANSQVRTFSPREPCCLSASHNRNAVLIMCEVQEAQFSLF